MPTQTTKKKNILVDKGLVVLTLNEYQELYRRAVPTYYLKGKAAEKVDKLVEEGLRDYRERRTKKIKSLADLD